MMRVFSYWMLNNNCSFRLCFFSERHSYPVSLYKIYLLPVVNICKPVIIRAALSWSFFNLFSYFSLQLVVLIASIIPYGCWDTLNRNGAIRVEFHNFLFVIQFFVHCTYLRVFYDSIQKINYGIYGKSLNGIQIPKFPKFGRHTQFMIFI